MTHQEQEILSMEALCLPCRTYPGGKRQSQTQQRWQIVEAAAVLFQRRSYEAVALEDIADSCSLTAGEVARVFSTKGEILKTIYDHYNAIVMPRQLPKEGYIPVLQSGNAGKVLELFVFQLPAPSKMSFAVLQMVHQRKNQDRSLRNANLCNAQKLVRHYIVSVLQTGVDMGLVDMTLDEIVAFSHSVNVVQEFLANLSSVIPRQSFWQSIQEEMVAPLAALIKLRERGKDSGTHEMERMPVIALAIRSLTGEIEKYIQYYSTLRKQGDVVCSRHLYRLIQHLLQELEQLYHYATRGGNVLGDYCPKDMQALLQEYGENGTKMGRPWRPFSIVE